MLHIELLDDIAAGRTQCFRRADILEPDDGGGSGGRGCPDSVADLQRSIASASLSLLVSLACNSFMPYNTFPTLTHDTPHVTCHMPHVTRHKR